MPSCVSSSALGRCFSTDVSSLSVPDSSALPRSTGVEYTTGQRAFGDFAEVWAARERDESFQPQSGATDKGKKRSEFEVKVAGITSKV